MVHSCAAGVESIIILEYPLYLNALVQAFRPLIVATNPW